ncbi:MAG: acyltransferase family protein [Ignavibacteriaceae bacterium]
MTIQKTERLVSLDVFRGITIAGMILVNNPGSWNHIYPALEHASWNGVTPTDLIFPFFLFIVGVAITISLTKRKERKDDQSKLLLQILRRSATLFLLGLIMYGFPKYDLSTIRIMGVLQRIAICYFISSFIFLKVNIKTIPYIAFGLLFIYWALMTLIPVPGVGYANLEPSTNLGAWFDRTILGVQHLWAGSKVWDPEGLLSDIPAIATTLLGVMTGDWLRKNIDSSTKVIWMFFWGNVGLVLGTIWDIWFPINKNLWTSSYVIFTAGMALQFLAMCYLLIDVKGFKSWTKPFVIYGMNAITVFFLSGIVDRIIGLIHVTNSNGQNTSLMNYLYTSLFTWWLSPINASLAWAILNILFWLGILWILYKKNIFIKV